MSTLAETDSPHPILILTERLNECWKRERPELLNAGATRAACWLHDAHAEALP